MVAYSCSVSNTLTQLYISQILTRLVMYVFIHFFTGALNGSNATLNDLHANLTRGKSPFITGIEFMGKSQGRCILRTPACMLQLKSFGYASAARLV